MNVGICNNMNGPGGYYELSQTEKEKYCVFTYMWNVKNETNKQV